LAGRTAAARRAPSHGRKKQQKRRRYAVVYDIDGPRIRLGLLWFAALVVAMVGGRWTLAALYAAVAAVAGFQASTAWRAGHQYPNRIVAGLGAGAMVVAAAYSTGALGAACLALGTMALGAAFGERRPGTSVIVTAGYTVQCGLFTGLGVGSVLVTARYGYGAAVALVLLVCAYEVGDYIVGSGATNPYEGPLAGLAAIAVVMFCVSVLGVTPFEFPGGLAYGALAAVGCPLGQLLASAILPAAGAPASALRRVDSLLVLGPVWAVILGRALS
jgi:hypothetical protein